MAIQVQRRTHRAARARIVLCEGLAYSPRTPPQSRHAIFCTDTSPGSSARVCVYRVCTGRKSEKRYARENADR